MSWEKRYMNSAFRQLIKPCGLSKLRERLRLASVTWLELRQMTMATSATNTGFQVQHDKQKKKFFIPLDSEEAVLDYAEKPKGVLDMYHTEVPVSHRGKRLGNILAEAAFNYVMLQDLKMRLTCTFLQKYARENPNEEYNKRIVQ